MDLRKRSITIAIMVAMFLGAVEGTVVTTAVPAIVRALNGFQLISWVFSLYLLTSAISTPIYGKLSDMYGRKNTLSIGIIIFIFGSSLCGLSSNMYELIAFRALQGLGAGAIFTITYTIVGDVFSLSERAKVQGWLSTVWGVASLAGPFLGGFLIDSLSWHWIFFINVPFGIVSIILLQKNLNENFEKKKHKIDYLGTLLLSASTTIFLFGVMSGENRRNIISVLISLGAAAALITLFYFVEEKAEEPIVPFEIFTKNNIVVNIISFLAAAILIASDVYMPVYIQNVLGHRATISGLAMAPMSIAWLLSSVILAKVISKYGERVITVISTLIILISTVLLPALSINSSIIMVIIYAFVMGLGLGGGFTILTIVIQASVDYSKRGTATASNSLLRTLGQTIGISVFGWIFNLSIVKYFSGLGINNIEPDNLYSSAGVTSGVSGELVKASLNSGLHAIFAALIIIAAVCFALAFTLSSGLKGKE